MTSLTGEQYVAYGYLMTSLTEEQCGLLLLDDVIDGRTMSGLLLPVWCY